MEIASDIPRAGTGAAIEPSLAKIYAANLSKYEGGLAFLNAWEYFVSESTSSKPPVDSMPVFWILQVKGELYTGRELTLRNSFFLIETYKLAN
jgi:hypothetical protein